MADARNRSDKFESLRQQAERLVQERSDNISEKPSEVLELIHELQVHQMELEVQNEELQRSQHELATLHREFENLYEFAPCGYLTLSAKGIITRANLTAVSLLGITRSLLTSLAFTYFVARGWEQTFLNALRRAGETGERQSLELPLHKDAEPASWVAADIDAEMDNGGAVRQWRVVLMDISGRKQAEEALIEAKRQAEHANKAKSEFLANMSHEIRTPLNGIMGMLQILQATNLNADQKAYVDMGYKSSQRLTRLLSDILDLSRIEADKMVIREEPFQIGEIMQSIRDIFAHGVKEQHNALNIHIDPDIPERLIGDSTRLTQILFNLVGNANKHTRRGRIDVRASLVPEVEREARQVLFTVADTGEGIAADKQEQIFETFSQGGTAASDTSRTHDGVGLGLPLVKRLVQLLNGSLNLDSSPGRGTTVSVRLPFVGRDAVIGTDQSQQAQEQGEAAKVSKRRVLVVDDERMAQIFLRQVLEEQGYVVEVQGNGEAALEALQQEAFDCILMDVRMPVMDGMEATRRIRSSQDWKHLPIIALTAYAMEGDREMLLDAGMDDYIAKPVDKQELLELLERNIRGAVR